MMFFFAGLVTSSLIMLWATRRKHYRFKMRPEWYIGITSDDLINDRVMFFE